MSTTTKEHGAIQLHHSEAPTFTTAGIYLSSIWVTNSVAS